jgi:hypothetical protein
MDPPFVFAQPGFVQTTNYLFGVAAGGASGDVVTTVPNQRAMVIVSTACSGSPDGTGCFMAYQVTGANTIGPGEQTSVGAHDIGNGMFNGSSVSVITLETPGVNTFTALYRTFSATGGTATFHIGSSVTVILIP